MITIISSAVVSRHSRTRTIRDPAAYDWRPVQKVQHYTISARAMTGSE